MRPTSLLSLCATTIAVALVIVGCSLTQVPPPSDADTCVGILTHQADPLTSAEFNGWFESGSVSLNGAVKPANSLQFPDQPNCSFYKWSEQMFLWLTSPAPPRYGSAGGLVMNSPAFFDISLPDANDQRSFQPHVAGRLRAFNLRTAQRGALDLPIVLQARSLRILEVLPPVVAASGRALVADALGNEVEVADIRREGAGRPTLIDTRGDPIREPRALIRSKTNPKATAVESKLERLERFDRSELVQKIAFKDKFVLLDLFGNFPEAEQGQADGGVLMAQNGSLVYYAITVNNVFALFRTMQGANVPPGTRFPTTQSDLDAITMFAAANGRSPVIDSEALAVEIKSSWVEAAGLVDADKFIQMTAIVPDYDRSNPSDWVPTGTRTVRLAMVGMHIVGSTGSINPANSTHGHPEMLWATFEHLSNGPAAQYTYARQSPNGPLTVPQNTSGNWVFSANGSAAPFNEMRMCTGVLCQPPADHIHAIAPFTISASNIRRDMPWGLPGNSPTGNAEVIGFNAAVRSMLDSADIRRNYFHEGTTWTVFGASPAPGNIVGTNRLENTTMETFNQGGNCFDCHTSRTTSTSHVFADTRPLF